jgi:hypothetical protein
MKLPFTTQQFLGVFKEYNTAIYPLQLLFFLFAALVIFLAFRKTKANSKIIMVILAAFWLWMGAIYHIGFFSAINKAAYGFGGLFILEGLLLLYYGLTKSYNFSFSKDSSGFAGILLILYAMVVYPLIGYFSTHAYPYAPTFGLPCPTTIFTFGILLFSKYRLPWAIVTIPILWSLIGFSAAFTLGIYEDSALIISGIAFTILNFIKPSNLTLASSTYFHC